jgi:predicted enzyme related to lactoylglutathione lyase
MTHRHHSIDYIEFPVDDIAAAKSFYSAAFGWTFTDYGPEYAGIRHPTEERAEVGGFNLSGTEGRGTGPLVQLYSDDLEASVAAVTAAGGNGDRGTVRIPGRSPIPLQRPGRQRAGRVERGRVASRCRA